MSWRVMTTRAGVEGLAATLPTKAAALEFARALQADGLPVLRLESADGEVIAMQPIDPDPLDSAPAGRRRRRQPPQQTAPAGRWSR